MFDWVGARVFDYLALEAAPGVRTYPLADKFFKVLSETSVVDGLVPFTVMVRTIFFRSGECGVVLDWP